MKHKDLNTKGIPTHLSLRKKDGQVSLTKLNLAEFKVFQSILGYLQLDFGTRHNTEYGIQDFVNELLVMAKGRGCANSAYQHGAPGVKIPSGSWWRKKITHSVAHMEQICDKMLIDTTEINKFKQKLRDTKQQGVIAIDKHKIPRYDKKPNMKHLIYSKFERGTKTFEAYITSKIVAGSLELNLSMCPVYRDRFNPEFVRKILEKCDKTNLKTKLCLLDREFYAADVMHVIKQANKQFIIPAKKDSKIKHAIMQHHKNLRDAVSPYTIGNISEGFTFNLVIVPAKGKQDSDDITEQYHVFATSLPCTNPDEIIRQIPELYKKRWGIETGYRVVESIRPRTNSPNHALRIFMFTVSLILSNLWICIRQNKGNQNYDVTVAGFLNKLINCYAMIVYTKWPPP